LAPIDDEGLNLESTFGLGTTFYFTLENKDLPLLSSIHEIPFIFPHTNNMIELNRKKGNYKPTVLIVDDDEFNFYALKLLLRNLGCRSEYANNGREALKMIINNYRDMPIE